MAFRRPGSRGVPQVACHGLGALGAGRSYLCRLDGMPLVHPAASDLRECRC